MIARSPIRCKPIPFSTPTPQMSSHAGAISWAPASPMAGGRLQANEPKRNSWSNPWSASLGMLSGQSPQTTGKAASPPATPDKSTASTGAPKGTRQATARYDGPHSLSIRSATSGRHYRFECTGATQVIDAIDISLMRRIEDITLL